MKFYCLKCGSKLSAESELYGKEIECPNCAKMLTVPFPERDSSTPTKKAGWRTDNDIPRLRPPRQQGSGASNVPEITAERRSTSKESKVSGDSLNRVALENQNDLEKDIFEERRNTTRPERSKDGGGFRLLGMIVFIALFGGGGIYWLVGGNGGVNKTNQIPEENVSVAKAPATAVNEEPDIQKEETKSAGLSEKPEEIPKEPGMGFKIVEEKKIDGSPCGVKKVLFGEFTVQADLNLNETVKVHFSVPLGENGKPVKNASNVVYHCPYMPERNFFKNDCHRWYSEVAGYTFFSMDIVSRLKDIYDRDKIYYYPESGFHDLVFKVKEMIEEYYRLENRNILLTGQSSGSVMAKEFILKYYDKVDAAAYIGGHQNIVLDRKATEASTACLVMFTCGDKYEAALRYTPNQIQVLRATTAPIWKSKGGKYFHHTASPQAWELIHQFIKSVVELRAKNGGKVPYFRDWPYSFKRTNGKTVYFPSKKVKKLWCELPQDAIDELDASYRLYDMNDETLKFHEFERKLIKHAIYFIPKDVSPKAVVVYIHDPAEDHKNKKVTQMDCLYYFMRHGFVGCSVKVGKDRKESFKRIAKLIRDVKRRKEWSELPIYVVGLGTGGELAALAALRYGDDIEKKRIPIKKGKVRIVKTKIIRHLRVKKIVTINSDYSTKRAINMLKKARGGSEIPVTMLYSSKYKRLKPQVNLKHMKVKEVKAKGITLDKKWFEILRKIAEGEDL